MVRLSSGSDDFHNLRAAVAAVSRLWECTEVGRQQGVQQMLQPPGQPCINPHTSGEGIKDPARIPLLRNSGPRGILRIHINTYPQSALSLPTFPPLGEQSRSVRWGLDTNAIGGGQEQYQYPGEMFRHRWFHRRPSLTPFGHFQRPACWMEPLMKSGARLLTVRGRTPRPTTYITHRDAGLAEEREQGFCETAWKDTDVKVLSWLSSQEVQIPSIINPVSHLGKMLQLQCPKTLE